MVIQGSDVKVVVADAVADGGGPRCQARDGGAGQGGELDDGDIGTLDGGGDLIGGLAGVALKAGPSGFCSGFFLGHIGKGGIGDDDAFGHSSALKPTDLRRSGLRTSIS